MMSALSTTAWVLHDLGLATNFGGALFGKLALNPAVKTIHSKKDRGRVQNAAWRTYSVFQGVSLAVAASTWIAGRLRLTGREIDRSTRGLVLAKDALLAPAVLTGFGATTAGLLMGREQERSGIIVEDGTYPASESSSRAQMLKQVSGGLGAINLVAAGCVLGVTAILAMKSGRSTKWSIWSRLLP